MNNFPNKRFAFDNFLFDAEKLALFYHNELIRKTERKCLEVLAVLLENANQPSSHEEIINRVWQDDPFGKTSLNTAQCVRKLRKLLAEYAPDKNYIETIKGSGYMFVGEVSCDESDFPVNINRELFESIPVLPKTEQETEKSSSSFLPAKTAFVFLAIITILPLTLLGWTWFSDNNEEEIERVVKESQLYESLVIYKNPSAFDESALDKYWTAELDINSNYDRQRIREAVQKLNAEGRRYGDETKCEQFEFQSVEINRDENFAVVKTLEKWFISVYFDDGSLQKNKTVGPYFVSYILRKIDGKWLIEKSTTARVNRPTPRLSEIAATTEIKSGQQFFVKITGQDFEPETVFIEVTGEGCPESRPCKVPNSALRENSKLSETALENVPLTLASGTFRITVRNGDSQASNALDLNVP